MLFMLSMMNWRSSAAHVVARRPAAAVCGGLVATPHDFLGQRRILVDRLADHEGGDLGAMLVEQVEEPRSALIDAVLENAIGRHVRQAVPDRLGNHAGGAGYGLTTAFVHQGHADREAGAVRPE
jgi:hypothetical protein